MKQVVRREIGGRPLVIETGVIAKQAGGAALVTYGGTVVLCAVTSGDPPLDTDFFPLTIDYREKAFAAGKIPGGFFKREGRPTTKETLSSRLMDRPIRPLFPEGFRKEVAVSATVLSADRQNDPDIIGMIAASAALAVSDVPFNGPIGAARIGRIGGEFIVNPTADQRAESELDLVVAGTRKAITMVECGAKEVPEDVMLDAIDAGFRVVREVTALIDELVAIAGKPKIAFEPPARDRALRDRVFSMAWADMKAALRTPGKLARKAKMREVSERITNALCPALPEGTPPTPGAPATKDVKAALEELELEVERETILKEHTRADGRAFHQIREISTELAVLPYTHGSALFTRGETQAIVTVTLGTSFDEQRIDGLHDEIKETFMLHYNFPSYSVGESWPNRGPKRREIGHGALAERALRAVLPEHDDFPYTVRIVSDITESNGSSSMASVCGGTLALMDAGVQIKQPVAGIAMGLVTDGREVCVLSDIQGSEDHNGDMDFKVAGTQRGITALQMDIKIEGLERSIMAKALDQAREGRIQILREMLGAIRAPRTELSPLAPRAIRMRIDPEKIGLVIGPGGKMIKGIQEETGSRIEIEDDGTVTIWGNNQESADGARARVEMLTQEVEEGRVYKGRVVSIQRFGCFVEVLPGQEGLVHVSELADGYVDNVDDVVRVGDEIEVKVIEIDPQGRIRLSRKALLIGQGTSAAPATSDGERGEPRTREHGERRDRGERSDRWERGGRSERGDRGGRDRGGFRDRDRERGDRRGPPRRR